MTDRFDVMRKIMRDNVENTNESIVENKNIENESDKQKTSEGNAYIDFENTDFLEINKDDFSIANNKNEETLVENCKICPNCNNKCSIEAVFCNRCGSKLEIEHKCPNCGTDYTEDDMFCIRCGTKLQEQPVQKVVEKLYCPVCNTEYKEGDIFCGECGTNLKTNQAFAINTNEELINQVTQKHTNFDKQATPQHIQNTETHNIAQDTVKCPYCGSMIARYTKKCPHCGEWLSGGVSHFGCGSFLVLITTIIAICMAIGGESIGIPLVGEIGGIWLVIVAFLYFLPSLISDWRGHDSKFAIFIVNLLFGWTFIGWFAALIFSFTGRSR